ncbi:hypothetical protein [Advenella sp. S44]|uniref:hypothetical protein n=1 Tax=Advenella sp. S44 TaxID=1982755 RepID=UPI001374717A|nr:hypothetical protein [Advenella sp. S44]
MATVDIDLTNQGVGIIDQSNYDGQTVLNILSDRYLVLDVRNEIGPTTMSSKLFELHAF